MKAQIYTNLDLFHGELRNFVLKKVRDTALADDIVQDVFLKVYTKIDQLKESDKLLGWIYQIARHTITDHFRKHQKTVNPNDLKWESDSNTLNECVARCLKQLIVTLPDKYKEAFQLSEIDNVSQIQLAERLGISYSGAKSRVQRARLLLKQKMQELLIIKTDAYGNVIVCEGRNLMCCKPGQSC
jgi:RNA polymerase sigma-70 factor (ECF subfamily)